MFGEICAIVERDFVMKYAEKKVLIISHNPLSRVNNNGKTLASIFKGLPEENIYQIYLNADIPDYSKDCHYLRINEKQIVRSLLKMKNFCCEEVESTPDIVSRATVRNRNFANHTKRLLRECVWKIGFWQSRLGEWLKDKSFDVVFFMAGDGMFAYDVYRFVMDHSSSKGCVFFTDDYILGRTSRFPAALLRQKLLKCKMQKTLRITEELYVISDEMKNAYKDIFGLDGYVVRNFLSERTTRVAEEQIEQNEQNGELVMVYAGGLHYNRWKVLSEIAHALKEINRISETKCFLKIYSAQNISREITDSLTIEGASEFCGGAPASQIADIYAKADILLHVESFDKKAVASTKYSFSTKIPEYLSANKCVLAVGPAEVASVRYLADFACVISDSVLLSSALSKLIGDRGYRDQVRADCGERYERDFTRKKQKECLNKILSC